MFTDQVQLPLVDGVRGVRVPKAPVLHPYDLAECSETQHEFAYHKLMTPNECADIEFRSKLDIVTSCVWCVGVD